MTTSRRLSEEEEAFLSGTKAGGRRTVCFLFCPSRLSQSLHNVETRKMELLAQNCETLSGRLAARWFTSTVAGRSAANQDGAQRADL